MGWGRSDNPQKLPLPLVGFGPPFNTWFFELTESATKTASVSVQLFLQVSGT